MKIRKIVLSLTLLFCFTVASIAATTPDKKTTSTTVSSIYKTLQKLDLDVDQMNSESVTLKFMVNDDDEIIVLSTQDSELDKTLKSVLNYKEVRNNDLIPYKIYVLPIRFQDQES